MITRQEFYNAGKVVSNALPAWLPIIIRYKCHIQETILDMTTSEELEDIYKSKPNEVIIDKLCKLAHKEWKLSFSCESLYCLAIAIGTIIKEYGWGTQYLLGEGNYTLAQRIVSTTTLR